MAGERVGRDQRYTKDRPCPICGGWQNLPSGQGRRCYGYSSVDGRYARCTREEYAGRLSPETDSNCYVHRMEGDCDCGIRHDPRPVTTKRVPSSERPREVAYYDYPDELSTLLYQVVRYEPKDFRQRRPRVPNPRNTRRSDWIYELGDIRLVPYRLPELLDADPNAWVLVVEGEKDVDRARNLGLTATCNVAGAGKWRDEYNAHFLGRRVAIIRDNDQAGRQHATKVAKALRGVAAEVRIVTLPDLPPKGDLSDWLDAGGTVEQLLALIETTPAEMSDPCSADSPVHGSEDNAVDELPPHPYREVRGSLVWDRPTKEGTIPQQLTNFTVRIVADIVEDDGAEVRRFFEMEAMPPGERRTFTVPVDRFASMQWVPEHLGAGAVVMPGVALKDHARAAIQLLSTSTRRIVYGHIGWREHEGEWIYLHAGGAISAKGAVSGVEVALPPPLRNYRLPAPPWDDDRRAAIRASLGFLAVAPSRITIPLHAATYRAPLGQADFSVFTEGHTGSGKSTIQALVQQHYGPAMDRTNLPGSWSSTDNALEMLAFLLKDAIFAIDDFIPKGSLNDRERMHQKADRIFRGQGNGAGRGRLNADTRLRTVRAPRGVIIASGEDVPRGESLGARVFTGTLRPGDLDKERQEACERDAAQGLYAKALAGYIAWLAPRAGELATYLRPHVLALRTWARTGRGHPRTPEIVANLAVGTMAFIDYALWSGAITVDEALAHWARTWKALREAAEQQAGYQATSDPGDRFFALVRAALGNGTAHVAGRDGREPDAPEAWGWRERKIGTGDHEREEWQPQGHRIGWVDGGALYLNPDAAYAAANSLGARNGEGVPIDPPALRRRLNEGGYLVHTDKARQTLTIRRRLEGQMREVLHLRAGSFVGDDPTQPDTSRAKPRIGATGIPPLVGFFDPPVPPPPGRDGEVSDDVGLCREDEQEVDASAHTALKRERIEL